MRVKWLDRLLNWLFLDCYGVAEVGSDLNTS